MKTKFTPLILFMSLLCGGLFAQVPLVYTEENTGASFGTPPLPLFSELPVIEPLSDPFMWSDNIARSTDFSDWARRRNEIKEEIEHYEIGNKPTRPDTITARYETGGTLPAGVTGRLIVDVTVNGRTLTLTSNVSLPAGSGPFPAIIGMNSLSGSIPADVFTSRNVARITYSHNNVTTYGNPQLTDPFFRLYPEQNLENTGQYAAWAWGVSRLIDGLELAQGSLPIDLSHIGVTGCSYAGKMALFSGAMDERIALTLAIESGGGGAPAWRVSETLGEVEKLGATDYRWFRDDMRQFSGSNVARLPHDHHELMAMVAPRALLVTGNTDFTWLANPSCYVSARAAHEVYKTFGIGDRFGFIVDGGHGHCAIPASQRPPIEAFVEKFLLGNTSANTDNVTVHPYPDLDYKRWYQWWGTGNPVLPAEPVGIRIWMEAECGTVGSNWNALTDTAASNDTYLVVTGLNSTGSAPAGDSAAIVLPFTIDSAGTYNLFARLDCPSANDDSYWIKFDNGPFVTVNGLATSGWQWLRLTSGTNLSIGSHTLTIAYREDGAKLDKLLLTTSGATIRGKGTEGSNCGQPPAVVPDQIFSVSESATNGSVIGDVQATDPDAGAEFQNWKIEGGSGDGIFDIEPTTGGLLVKDSTSLDFESSVRSYNLIITVTDGYFKSAPDTIVINLTNANDRAPVVNPASFIIRENAIAGSLVGTASATDADDTNEPGATILQNWTITGGTGAAVFAINDSSGEISVSGELDFETSTSYTIHVTVSDGTNTSEEGTITINIQNENDNKPVVTEGQSFSVSEDAHRGTSLGTVTATDPDDLNEPGFTVLNDWKITGGTGAWFFDINENTGEITVRLNWLFDFEWITSYSLRVSVSDGENRSHSRYVTIHMTNENDNAPEVKRDQHFYIDNWVSDGDIAGIVGAKDDDDRNDPGFTSFSDWKITGGSGERLFEINPATGELIIVSSGRLNRDDETYSLKVRVSDGKFRSESEYIKIHVSGKVDICHNGRTIKVSRSSVPSHLRHGDTPNACGGNHIATASLAMADEDTDSVSYEIFPNPVTTSTREISVSLGANKHNIKTIQLVEFNTSRIVKEISVRNESSISIPSGNVSRGMYVLRLLGDRQIMKIIIVE